VRCAVRPGVNLRRREIMFRFQLLRFAVTLSFLVPSAIAAQVPADLQEAMSVRDLAVAKADAATWDRLTTEDFTVVDATGTLLTKAMRLAQIKTDTATTLAPREDVTIKQYGDVFVRRFRAGAIWVLDIWVKEAKAWRVAVVQVTPAKK
jgi:hypothetical protein